MITKRVPQPFVDKNIFSKRDKRARTVRATDHMTKPTTKEIYQLRELARYLIPDTRYIERTLIKRKGR